MGLNAYRGNENFLKDLVEFFTIGSVVQCTLWTKLQRRFGVTEKEKKQQTVETRHSVSALSAPDGVLLLKVVQKCVPLLLGLVKIGATFGQTWNLNCH